jgi:GDP-D-mannose dehydratase
MDAKRDWGHAKDYIEMQWLMLQTGQTRRLRQRRRQGTGYGNPLGK